MPERLLRARAAVDGSDQPEHAGGVGGQPVRPEMSEGAAERQLAGAPARQGGPRHGPVQPDQGQAAPGGDREAGRRDARLIQGVKGQLEHMARVAAGVLGAVEVEVDEQGVELGQAGDQPARTEEAVLGEVDVGNAGELAHGVGQILDRERPLAPAAANEAGGERHAAKAGGVQGQGMVGRA